MPIHAEDKEKLVDALEIAAQKAQRLEITLLFQGKEKEAARVRQKTVRLRKAIDGLLAELMRSWSGDARILADRLKKTNARLQAAARDIKKETRTAEQVVKVLGYLDEVIGIAAGLLA